MPVTSRCTISQHVEEIERAESRAEHQAEDADAERLDPDRPAHLPVQRADGPQHAEFASPILIDTVNVLMMPSTATEHGHGDLQRRQPEPLADEPHDVGSCSSALVRTNTWRRPSNRSRIRCLTVETVGAGRRVDAEQIHGVVVPVLG